MKKKDRIAALENEIAKLADVHNRLNTRVLKLERAQEPQTEWGKVVGDFLDSRPDVKEPEAEEYIYVTVRHPRNGYTKTYQCREEDYNCVEGTHADGEGSLSIRMAGITGSCKD